MNRYLVQDASGSRFEDDVDLVMRSDLRGAARIIAIVGNLPAKGTRFVDTGNGAIIVNWNVS